MRHLAVLSHFESTLVVDASVQRVHGSGRDARASGAASSGSIRTESTSRRASHSGSALVPAEVASKSNDLGQSAMPTT